MKNFISTIFKGFKSVISLFLFFITINIILISINSCRNDSSDSYVDNVSYNNSLTTLFKKIDANKQKFINFKNKKNNPNIMGREYLELEAIYLTDELQEESLNVFRSLGVTDAEIIQEMGSLSNPDIVAAAMEVMSVETGAVSIDLYLDNSPIPILFNTSKAQSWQEYGTCAAAALGLNIFDGLRAGGQLTKQVAMTILKKAAVRVMGPIGVAITVAEFGVCLAGF